MTGSLRAGGITVSNATDQKPVVYVSGGGTASGRPASESTSRPDSLATIIRDGVIVSAAPGIVDLYIAEPERRKPTGA